MKCIAVLVIALVACVAADEKWDPSQFTSNYREIHEKCVEESGMSSDQIAKIKNFERPDEKEVHEYIHCSVKKLEIFSDETGFYADRLMMAFSGMGVDVDKAREIVTKCVDSNEQKSTPAEWAFRGVECMMSNKIDDLLKEAQDKLKNKDH